MLSEPSQIIVAARIRERMHEATQARLGRTANAGRAVRQPGRRLSAIRLPVDLLRLLARVAGAA